MPGSTFCSSPATIECSIARFESWSATITATATRPARSQAASASGTRRGRPPGTGCEALGGPRSSTGRIELTVDQAIDDDAVDDLQGDDCQKRAEIDPPERGDQTAEDAQEWLADVAQKTEHDVDGA